VNLVQFVLHSPGVKITSDDIFERLLIQTFVLAMEVCNLTLKSSDIDIDLPLLLQTFHTSIETRAIKDFVVPLYFFLANSPEILLSIDSDRLSKEKGSFDLSNDFIPIVRTHSHIIKQLADINLFRGFEHRKTVVQYH
jgi:hypothetical protein